MLQLTPERLPLLLRGCAGSERLFHPHLFGRAYFVCLQEGWCRCLLLHLLSYDRSILLITRTANSRRWCDDFFLNSWHLHRRSWHMTISCLGYVRIRRLLGNKREMRLMSPCTIGMMPLPSAMFRRKVRGGKSSISTEEHIRVPQDHAKQAPPSADVIALATPIISVVFAHCRKGQVAREGSRRAGVPRES